MDICALTDTLIVEQDGIYDPNAFNDRVLLGFQGTWSHTELHALRCVSKMPKLHKARKGELRATPRLVTSTMPPGRVLDPDESGRGGGSAVSAVPGARQCLWVMRRGPARPALSPSASAPGASGASPGSVEPGRVLAILHNPLYTGTYVYGRRRSQPVVEAGQVTRMRTCKKPPHEWTVVLPNAHPALYQLGQYVANTEQLTRNRTKVLRVAGRPVRAPRSCKASALRAVGRRCRCAIKAQEAAAPSTNAARRLHDGRGVSAGLCQARSRALSSACACRRDVAICRLFRSAHAV